MFAGIGGFRSGLTRAGGFQCVGHCEIDKNANASYTAIYEPGKEERYYPDATKIDPADLPDFELLCGGFPCQAFSNAGRRRDIKAILLGHNFHLAQSLDLHSQLFSLTDDVVRHRTAAAVGKVFLLLLDQEVDTVQGHTAIIADDTATAVSIRQLGYVCVWMQVIRLPMTFASFRAEISTAYRLSIGACGNLIGLVNSEIRMHTA